MRIYHRKQKMIDSRISISLLEYMSEIPLIGDMIDPQKAEEDYDRQRVQISQKIYPAELD